MQALSENWTMPTNGESWDTAQPTKTGSAAREYLPEEATPALPPLARPLAELVRHRFNDPNELLQHRFLCRLGTLLVCGPTGIGKSSLAMQMMVSWSLAREAFGIKPAGPLKSLLIQAENDDGDQAEMRDGVFAGLELTDAECDHAGTNIIVAREDVRSGLDFLRQTVRPLLAEHRPDLVWLDPMFSFLGGESNSGKDVGGFLRNGLNPLLREFNCGAVEIHHTNKPASGTEKPKWAAGDFAYLGSGSAEWANHARAVLALRSIGSHEVFELQAGKRGSRLGWQESDGTKSFVKHLAHAKEPGVICWREVSADELDTGGRPKQFDAGEMWDLLPPEGMTSTEWQEAAARECGIKETSWHRYRRSLSEADRIIKSKSSGKWQPVTKRA